MAEERMLRSFAHYRHPGVTMVDGGSIRLIREPDRCIADVDVIVGYDGRSPHDPGGETEIKKQLPLPADAWERNEEELLQEIYLLSGIDGYLK